jgi:hypothetical protein
MSLGHLLRFELAHLSCVRLVGFGMNFDLIAQICTFVGACFKLAFIIYIASLASFSCPTAPPCIQYSDTSSDPNRLR